MVADGDRDETYPVGSKDSHEITQDDGFWARPEHWRPDDYVKSASGQPCRSCRELRNMVMDVVEHGGRETTQ